jgi:hypothetical protein
MKKLLIITAISTVLTFPALADYYVAGSMDGWAGPNSYLMTDLGGGIYQRIFTGLTPGRYEFKVTDGTWGWNYPGANSWLYTDGSGNVTITYDVNTYADGWSATSQRIGLNVDPGSWTAAGDFQGWNNAAGNMVPLGGGIYECTVSTVGTWNWKPVVTGSWDSISWDNRSVGTANWVVTVNPGEEAHLYVDALKGVAKVDIVAVPEPSTLALCALSGLAMLMVARKKN